MCYNSVGVTVTMIFCSDGYLLHQIGRDVPIFEVTESCSVVWRQQDENQQYNISR